MKKKPIFKNFILVLLSVFLLIGCSDQKKTYNGDKSASPKTSLQSKSHKRDKHSSSEQEKRTESASESSQSSSSSSEESREAESLSPIDTGAILKADYSTAAGTWKNAQGQTLTFNAQGLTTSGMTVSLLDIDQDGILLLNVETGNKTNLTLYMVTANHTLPQRYFSNGQTDTSDKSKDRIISSKTLSSNQLADHVYYHVSNH
ncbi:DUF6287 domain-containing protein [Streptococcus ratti]|uniref:DUF6287 domain-containing protein n=1 Tax=Streptococcus ratti FA-1 = DSM 20564 TaxID=699248 RepID=A0ABN0GTA4_STRRT|nr:DUF6287 domain-containing protein [Streptococcus ratti]EJN93613.1 hypothetical protein SRA_03726 [Streptococcus ratti FA-1 = DSM 20564]EMP69789.1 hypothetical protein D822_06688 [Streptococcus ratti FA-1 = DSM 20564]QEY07481.1 hypothetical protein FY406_07450 [Streptococcus ratti]VEI59932.1 lipoprotein [Streptococcus mutans]